MQQAVEKCPKVSISCKGVQMPSLLDSGSKISLIHQIYFKEHLLPRIETPMVEKADVRALFNLTVANNWQLCVKMYIEMYINFWGVKVPNVCFLILEEPNSVLDKKHHTGLPDIIGWNMVQPVSQIFMEKMWGKNCSSFKCLGRVNALLFSQLFLYHYAEISKDHNLAVQSIYHQTDSDIQSTPTKMVKKSNHPSSGKMGL